MPHRALCNRSQTRQGPRFFWVFSNKGRGKDRPRANSAVSESCSRRPALAGSLFPHSPKTKERLVALVKEFPTEVSWTVAFDGRQLGSVRSVNAREFANYADVGVQEIDRGANVPRVGTKLSWVIPGWYRPLVLVSRPNYEDPDQWKPRWGVVAGANVTSAFRKLLASERGYDTEFTDGLPEHKVPAFADKDVVVVRAYVARTGQQLLAIALSRNVAPWAYGPGLRDWAIRWFAVLDQATEVPLGDFLSLVDAGDYDRDGRSELLFYKAGYDLGEYIIWWDGFTRHASFGWSPH
jgi:hypothetical protein